MSYNSYNYLGAYIEMPEVENVISKDIRCCSNKNCSNNIEKMNKDSQYCYKCGFKIEQLSKEITISTVLDYYSFAEKNGLDAELFSQVKERHVLIPNRHFGYVAKWDESQEMSLEFVWGDSRKALVEFTHEAQLFIDKVKEMYGKQLEVKFGIVSYCM